MVDDEGQDDRNQFRNFLAQIFENGDLAIAALIPKPTPTAQTTTAKTEELLESTAVKFSGKASAARPADWRR